MPPVYPERSKAGLHPRAQQCPDKLNAQLVYAIYDGSALKIGKTDKHPKTRMGELQVGNPRKLELLAYTSHITESQAHTILARCHLRGEWYCLCVESLTYIGKFDYVDRALWSELMKDEVKGGW